MIPTVLHAGCKVNLGLHITGVRPNGYHELDSLFWPLKEPCDLLHLTPKSEPGMSISCSEASIDLQNNTLTKAYSLFCTASGFTPSFHLHLEKYIPQGAGLGGGSSDAASLLLWLNSQAPKPLSIDMLHAVGLRIGADVPFFLRNQPCRVQGIGEIITPYCKKMLAGYTLLLLCPPLCISTPWAYQAWDSLPDIKKEKKSLTTQAVKVREFTACEEWSVNDLESAVFPHYPLLANIKQALLDYGASAAVMSGSGSSMVGIFANNTTAGYAFTHCAESIRVRFLQQL